MLVDQQPEFRISSFCQDGGCVEIAVGEAEVLVRDKKNPASPILAFGDASWRSFLHSLNGEVPRVD